jgi:hypothetical protein
MRELGKLGLYRFRVEANDMQRKLAYSLALAMKILLYFNICSTTLAELYS